MFYLIAYICCICFTLQGVLSAPVTTQQPEEKGTMTAGELIAKANERMGLYDDELVVNLPDDVHSSSSLSDENLWPNGVVYYRLSNEFSETEKTFIRKFGPQEISKKVPCIRFVELYSEPSSGHYIYVQNLKGCYSYIGYSKMPRQSYQELSLSKVGCFYEPVVTHEFMHALGVFHQQARPDRDDYVVVHHENIIEGYERNFEKNIEMNTHNVKYSGQSIMHYGRTTFSKGDNPAITWRSDYNRELGGSEMAEGDILQLKRMYGCDDSELTTTTTPTTTTTTPRTTTTTPETTTTTPEITTTTPEITTTTPKTTTTTPEITTTTPKTTTTTPEITITTPKTKTTTPKKTTTTEIKTTTETDEKCVDDSKYCFTATKSLCNNPSFPYAERCKRSCGFCEPKEEKQCGNRRDRWIMCRSYATIGRCKKVFWIRFLCTKKCCELAN